MNCAFRRRRFDGWRRFATPPRIVQKGPRIASKRPNGEWSLLIRETLQMAPKSIWGHPGIPPPADSTVGERDAVALAVGRCGGVFHAYIRARMRMRAWARTPRAQRFSIFEGSERGLKCTCYAGIRTRGRRIYTTYIDDDRGDRPSERPRKRKPKVSGRKGSCAWGECTTTAEPYVKHAFFSGGIFIYVVYKIT